MNWEAVNAIAQLVGSLGVVVSLWYLAIQVHRHDLFSDRFAHFVASLEPPAQRLTVANLLGEEIAPGDREK